MWVSPFRYPRIHRYLLLPAAFRSLSRLSSALSAKASTLCSFLLDRLPPLGGPPHSVAEAVGPDLISSSVEIEMKSIKKKNIFDVYSLCMQFSRYV